MIIIPVINCASARCVKEKLETLAKFSPRARWVHIDVGEKSVSATKAPLFSQILAPNAKRFDFALHCMVAEKSFFSSSHAKSGAKLVYYHLGEIKNLKKFEICTAEWKKRGINIGVVVCVGDDISAIKIPKGVRYILVLAVRPGPAGQKFDPRAIREVSFLRKKYPRGILTVDGGITPAIVKKLSRAGADAVTSSAYIWESANPEEKYKELAYNSKVKNQNAKV
jgi:pentose-5-phosphate-3-epimerase